MCIDKKVLLSIWIFTVYLFTRLGFIDLKANKCCHLNKETYQVDLGLSVLKPRVSSDFVSNTGPGP